MNKQEFNNKYKAFLEPGHYGCALERPEALKYLDDEFQELTKIPGFQFSQIKGKFSSFRFYCEGVHRDKVAEIEETLKQIYL